MMKEIYLDNAATTRCLPEVAEAVAHALTVEYGNPSSMHRKGILAEDIWKRALKDIAGVFGAKTEEILFTSGGTESDNLALFGVAHAYARKGKHIITSAVEHPAVAATAEALTAEGYEITVLPVDADGLVDPAAAAAAVRPDTILISVMTVNNEIGTVQQVKEIAGAVKEKNPSILVHTDAVQAVGECALSPGRDGVDLLSGSGHKFHGPKGTGFLYVKKGVRLRPVLFGGGQQQGLRSGTDNVPGAAGLAAALLTVSGERAETAARLCALRDGFVREVTETVPDVRINGALGSSRADVRENMAAPHIVNLSVKGVRAEVLLHALEDKGIYVSAGSACASHAAKKTPGSATLRAIGLEEPWLSSAIRFSFSRETTGKELRETAEALRALVPELRRFT